MKVGQVIVRFTPGVSGWGGAARVATDWTKVLAQKGLDISVFTVKPEGELQCLDRDPNLIIYSLPESKNLMAKWWSFYAPTLSRALATEVSKLDIVHIHEIWHYPCYAAYRIAKIARKPFVITTHGSLEPWALKFKGLKKKFYAALIQRRILNEAAAIHAITQGEVKDIRAFGVHRPVVVIPNGIDPGEFCDPPKKEEIEKLYPELRGKKVVLFLGRIHPIKGLDILARAFGQLAVNREDIYLIIAGPDEGGYQDKVEQVLKMNRVQDKTIFTGMVTGREKLAVLSRADVCVIPSYSEVRSIVALEAMISEIPIVITRQCQFSEVKEANAGIVIEPNVEDLVGALRSLIDRSDLRKEMGANGRRLVMERFTWDKIAGQMVELYQNVLEGNLR